MSDKENEALVSAPGTLEIGGRTLLVSKHTEKDVYACLQYARQQAKKHYNPLKDAAEALQDIPGVTEEQKTKILLQAYAVKASGELPDSAISDEITSANGCAFQLWILARKHHPELTLEQCQGMVTEDNCMQVYADLDEASGANLIKHGLESTPFFSPRLP